MDEININRKLSNIDEELDLKKIERRELTELYEREKMSVRRLGIIAASLILFHETLLAWLATNQKHASLMLIAIYIRPIVYISFLILTFFVIIRGFDVFINSRLEYGRKLSEKFKRRSFTQEIDILSKAINFLESEAGRIQEDLIHKRAEAELNEKPDKKVEIIKNFIDDEAEDEFEGSSDEIWRRDVLHYK